MISLYSGLAALAFLNARHLFEFKVKLLNLPAQGTRLLRTLRAILGKIVRNDPIRGVG